MPQMIVTAIMMLPEIGLIVLHINQSTYSWLLGGRSYTIVPMVLYSIFLFVFFLSFTNLFPAKMISKFRYSSVAEVRVSALNLMIFAILAFLIVMILFNGFSVITGDLSKEDVRKLGPLHAFVTKYLQPTIFAYACLLKRFEVKGISSGCILIIAIITLISGLASGGKASAIFVMLPGLFALYWDKFNYKIAIGFVITSISVMLFAGILFDSNIEGGFLGMSVYILNRAFILTAELPYRVIELQLNELLDFNYLLTLFEVFGKSIVRKVLENPSEVYQYNFSMAVSALIYPELVDSVNAGEWNMTPNVFVEAFLLGGTPFFLVFALGAGIFTKFILLNIQEMIEKKRYRLASIALTYFVFVFLSWLNSAGVTQLLHPLMILSLGGVWLIFRILGRKIRPINTTK